MAITSIEQNDFKEILDDSNISWHDFEGATVLITGAAGMLAGSFC